MFMGEYNHTIDGKGRVIVPAKFRDALGDGFVVTKGLDGCLFVYPPDAWQAFDNGIATINTEVCDQLGYDFDEISKTFEPLCTAVKGIETAEEFEEEEFEADELDEATVLPLPFFRGGSKYFTPSRSSSLPRNCFLFSSRNS